MHQTIEPAILYFGTPVVLISTVNEDGSSNLAPMSSAWWLGWRCMLGLSAASQTTTNLIRSGECVLNLPSTDLVAAVNRLARTTSTYPVPEGKRSRGYRYERDKFGLARLTPFSSETVAAPRVLECPVQLEAQLEATHGLAEHDALVGGRLMALEVRIQRVHVDEAIMMSGERNRIDPDRWRPLIMSFQQFYGLEQHQLHESLLAQIPEALYRTSDIERARLASLKS